MSLIWLQVRIERWVTPVALTALLASLVLMLANGSADLLKTTGQGSTGSNTDLATLNGAIESVQGPATAIMGSVATIGILAGGTLMAGGNAKGARIMLHSGGAGAAVLVGNGLAA